VFAVLYVLISPLPEMAATDCGRWFVFLAFSFSLVLVVAVKPFLPFLQWRLSKSEPGLNRALLCSRLC
jgi:hypothetical protein